VGLRAGLERCGKSRPRRDSIPDRPARRQSLYPLRYPACTKCLYEIRNYFHEVIFSFKRRITVFGYTVACYTQLRFTFEHQGRADISDRNLC
jgi:hypothetical protein